MNQSPKDKHEHKEFRVPQLDYIASLPSKMDYGIGCIGAGGIMRNTHLVAYHNLGLNLVAITDAVPQAARETAQLRGVSTVYDSLTDLLDDARIEIVDVAVPPHAQLEIVREIVRRPHIRGIQLQKPIAPNLAQASEIVALCERAGKKIGVNQNMRYEPSIHALKTLLTLGILGTPILATIEMRVTMNWQSFMHHTDRLMILNMSIHHLDGFRYLFGDPTRVFTSAQVDRRHAFVQDGSAFYILEYADGLRALGLDDGYGGPDRLTHADENFVRWRVEGTQGMAIGTMGWSKQSTLKFMTTQKPDYWFEPRLSAVWFPDAFGATMLQLMRAVDNNSEPEISGRDNLKTMALVEACYQSLAEHRAVQVAYA